jgi:hypothetical protein
MEAAFSARTDQSHSVSKRGRVEKGPRIGHLDPVRQPHDRRVFSTPLNTSSKPGV